MNICRLLMLVIFLSGCTVATERMWMKGSYSETLTGFYLDTENNHLIVSGEKYSYVFNINSEFKSVLMASRTINFDLLFRGFDLDSKNNITGQVVFSVITEELSKNELIEVKRLGFTDAYGRSTKSSSFQNLSGKVYKLEGVLPMTTLENSYIVKIKAPTGPVKTIGKIVATPATITFDVFVVTPSAIFIVLVMAVASF